jgi:uncharacterized membrane protein YgdD (TMEM256/DUF423 family)
MNKKITAFGALLGFTAILLGAFGAHALKKYLSLEQLAIFETGVKYQMYHALFLLFVSVIDFLTEKTKKTILNLTLIGVFMFSGSIYLLATKNVSGIDFKTIGIVTPIGGTLLLLAWAVLFYNTICKKNII